ncbi:MAG: hypothetical protein V2A79_05245, partial [Planctomycetota bacterium]
MNYEITGLLSDTQNEGLAGFLFELAFTGGPLVPADTPTGAPMVNFASPAGITGPAGFGGAAVGSRLVLVGGAQNTIKNTADIAPFPIGSVITGLAQTETVLVTGSLTAPVQSGTYTLSVSNLKAIVIQQGQDGSGVVWATEPAGVGTITNLTVIVPSASPAATASNDGPVCAAQPLTLLGGPDGMAGYRWTGPGGFTSTAQNPVLSPAVRGTYTLTVTDANDCLSTARTTVDLWPGPCATIVDCNSNGFDDACDMAAGTSQDANTNGIPDECAANLVAAAPATQGTLWRTAGNTIRLTFDKDIAVPAAGQILIQELLEGAGNFGPDLSSGFALSVENDAQSRPRVLRIRENATSVAHRRWFG